MSSGPRPTRSAACNARWRDSLFFTPLSRSTVAILSATVLCGNRPECCKTYPIERRSWVGFSSRTSLPSMVTVPLLGATSWLTHCSNVVLPQPEDPSRTVILPLGASRENRSTAGASCPGYCTVTSLKVITPPEPIGPLGAMQRTGAGSQERRAARQRRQAEPLVAEVQVRLRRGRPALALVLRTHRTRTIGVFCRAGELENRQLADLHPRVQGDRQVRGIGQL